GHVAVRGKGSRAARAVGIDHVATARRARVRREEIGAVDRRDARPAAAALAGRAAVGRRRAAEGAGAGDALLAARARRSAVAAVGAVARDLRAERAHVVLAAAAL